MKTHVFDLVFCLDIYSDRLDAGDHYMTWREAKWKISEDANGPFSFCQYPFLLNAGAKSRLFQVECRLNMRQVRVNK